MGLLDDPGRFSRLQRPKNFKEWQTAVDLAHQFGIRRLEHRLVY